MDLMNDPHDTGWMIKLEISDESELKNLVEADEYEQITKEQEH